MRESYGPNPLEQINRSEYIKKSLLEFPSGISRLKTSLEQKNEIDIIEAESWLVAAYRMLLPIENEVFVNSIDTPVIHRKLSAGFASTSYVFETQNGKWVIKIGAKKSPLIGYPDPSAEPYARWYYGNLQILRQIFDSHLPYLVPTPQEVLYTTNDVRFTTLIIQPFIDNILRFSDVRLLQNSDKRQLSNELEIFDLLTEDMRNNFNLFPDLLGGRGNIGIVQKEDGAHLILLDNGLIDGRAPSPVHKLINSMYYRYKINREKKYLESLLNE